MLRVVLVLALAASAYGYGRIVGGEPVEITEYNYQISLQRRGSHTCGGSLVKPDIVVTAAHCVHGRNKDDFTVRAGSGVIGKGGEIRNVQELNYDSRFNPSTLDYDVAVIRVSEPFPLSDVIGLVRLISRGSNIEVGTPSIVTGWGTLKEGGSLVSQLQAVAVPNVNREDCQDAYTFYKITDRMSCWGVTGGGKDACQGDSGGPLVIFDEEGNPELAGIVSWGIGCARPTHPGVYSDVSNEDIHDYITQYYPEE